MKHIYIILFSLALVACGNSEKNDTSLKEDISNSNEIIISQSQFTNGEMALGRLEEYAFNQTIKTSGFIDVPPKNKATISTFMGGYIKNTPLLIGDKVKKGDVLITIENPEFVELQQAYLEIAEQLNYLKSEFNRQKTLYAENITSQKNFLKAESNYKSYLAQYNGLRKKMVMLNINPLTVEQGKITSTVNLYSPIDGFITEVNISNGKYVSPSDVIMKIINTEHIHLELSVFEKDILNIKEKQKIIFQIPEASQNSFEAEVHLVGTTIDETNRTVKIHAHIINEEQANFIVGMFVEANIITNESKLLALSKDAILEHDDDYFSLVLKEKMNDSYIFEKIKLDLNKENETHASVINTNDLTNKDVLIKGGFMLLNEGGGGGHSH